MEVRMYNLIVEWTEAKKLLESEEEEDTRLNILLNGKDGQYNFQHGNIKKTLKNWMTLFKYIRSKKVRSSPFLSLRKSVSL